MTRNWPIRLAGAALALALSANTLAALELKFAHSSSTTSYGHLAALEFKKHVEDCLTSAPTGTI